MIGKLLNLNMNTYKVLSNNSFKKENFSLVPIRLEDRYDIMHWRNEQMYHLRQNSPLTKEEQDNYFENVIVDLFTQKQPDQILFSFLEAERCIGYGGLVHINWKDRNAEVSFIMDTRLEKDHFEKYWLIYLSLIEKAAFFDLGLHKIYTYAFDLRPQLYNILERKGYEKEAWLKDHVLINQNYTDVLIHAKRSDIYFLRKVNAYDAIDTFKWASDPRVRIYSFSTKEITWEEHGEWFSGKLNDDRCEYFILEQGGFSIGSIRFEMEANGDTVISYLIDPDFQGKGLGKYILEKGAERLKNERPEIRKVCGFVKKENIASIKIFEKLGYDKIADDGNILKFERRL